MYKTLHGETPSYLQDSFPATGNERYALRNEHNVPQIRSRTSMFHNSFIPKTIQDWNKLDNRIKGADSTESFTRLLKKDVAAVDKWFYCGDRRSSILHARMRMLCSPLNDHLFSHIHVVDSPACNCGHHRENNKHFLLDCALFINERTTMLNELSQIDFKPTVTNLLNGNRLYSEETNSEAFGYVQGFITSSGRFD